MEYSYEFDRDKIVSPWCTKSNYRCYVAVHFHYMVEILYAIDSGMRVNVDNRWIELNSGEYILINSGVAHATENPSGSWHLVASIAKYALMPSLSIFTKDYYIGKDDENETMLNLLKCMKGSGILTPWKADITYNLFLISISNAVMSLFAAMEPRRTHIKREDPFLEIIEHICENYRDTSLTTEGLALKFGYTPRMLSDMFAANLKIGVKKYIDVLRINDAKFQLLSTFDSIEEISAKVGYESVRSFYRIFSKHTGMTPGNYRSMGDS